MSRHAHLYKTREWREIRDGQLSSQPFCCMCARRGRQVRATVCDHLERHNGDPERFFTGPFQSLCKEHHDSDKQSIERGGTRHLRGSDADGWPHWRNQ